MFKGRIGRLAYFLGWVYLLLPLVILLVILLAVGGFSKGAHSGPNFSSAVSIIVLILDLLWLVFYLVAGFGLIIRRWHDLNQSGWLALLQFIPIVSIICSLIQLFAPGTKGSNNYGDSANPSLNFKTVIMGGGSAGSSSADPHFAAIQTPVPSTPDAQAPQTPPAPAPIQPQTVQPTPPTPVPPTPSATPPAPAPEQSGSDQPQAKL
jgi:uncharacterized membrane protein YhaH (DUF805 family)